SALAAASQSAAGVAGLFQNTAGGDLVQGQSSGGATVFRLWNNGSAYFAGNVGIGTPSPRNQLEIRGANNALVLADIGCGAGIGAIAPMGSANYQFLGQSNGSTFINSSSLGGIHFRHNNGEADQMTILPGGNVGVGTTNPTTKLEVIGTVKASVVQITG